MGKSNAMHAEYWIPLPLVKLSCDAIFQMKDYGQNVKTLRDSSLADLSFFNSIYTVL